MVTVTRTVDIEKSAINFKVSPHEVSLLRIFLCKLFRLKLQFCFENIESLTITQKAQTERSKP